MKALDQMIVERSKEKVSERLALRRINPKKHPVHPVNHV
jgi:hypothetical protein